MTQKLNTKIHTLIVENELDHFTLLDIRKAYEKAFDDKPNATEVRKYLYRQIYRLVKEGLLAKNGIHNSQNITYSKTLLFMNKFHLTSTTESKNHGVDCSIAGIESKLVSYKLIFQHLLLNQRNTNSSRKKTLICGQLFMRSCKALEKEAQGYLVR